MGSMGSKAKPSGYSGTPLPQKLGIKDDYSVAILGAPRGFADVLGTLPTGARVAKKVGSKAMHDVLVVFLKKRAALVMAIKDLRGHMEPAAGLWIAWPKKSSGVATDITEDVIREVALPTGLVDNKVCAIDETWSGLRLVIRREHR